MTLILLPTFLPCLRINLKMSNSKLSTEILIGLATAPLLAALLGSKALAEAAQRIGQASEELFRGDRLPVLNQPISPDDESEG